MLTALIWCSKYYDSYVAAIQFENNSMYTMAVSMWVLEITNRREAPSHQDPAFDIYVIYIYLCRAMSDPKFWHLCTDDQFVRIRPTIGSQISAMYANGTRPPSVRIRV